MAGWLTKATKTKQQTQNEEAQPFRVNCACGGRVAGTRRENFQRQLCAKCGEAFFILPLDAYPPLPARKRRSKKKRRSNKGSTGMLAVAGGEMVDWLGDLRSGLANRVARGMASGREWTIRQTGNVRSFFTPLRSVIVAIVCVIILTGSLAIRRQAVDRAEIVLRESLAKGEEALQSGNFQDALPQMEIARDAVETIGRNDEQAMNVKQMFRETRAAANLSATPLVEIVTRSIQTAQTKGPAEQADEFRLHHAGSWIVLDSIAYRLSTESGTQILLDYPIAVSDANVFIDAGQALLEPILGERDEVRVILAGQLAGFQPMPDSPGRWQLQLDSKTVFLWASAETYANLGFAPFEEGEQQEVADVLKSQHERAGAVP